MIVLISGLILIFLSTVADWVLYKAIRRHLFPKGNYGKYWIAQNILCALWLIAILVLFYYRLSGMTTLVQGLFIYFLLTIPKLLFLLFWMVGIFPFSRLTRVSRITTWFGLLIVLTTFGFILHGGLFGAEHLQVKQVNIRSTRVPEGLNGLRIVQFSDFHLGGFPESSDFIKRVVTQINALNPDIVLFTGDLVNSQASEILPFKQELSKIHAKYGVYSVMGNHDYGNYYAWNSEKERLQNVADFRSMQREMGWSLLDNVSTFVVHGNDTLNIIGVENWGDPPFGQHGDLKKAIAGIDTAAHFNILLSHNPVHWDEEVVPDTQIDLTLSGHTHAMQIQFGNLSPAWFRYKKWGGLYQQEGQYLYVNRGLGTVLLPMRIGAYPEITLIELYKQ